MQRVCKESTQRSGPSVYKALCDAIEEHTIDGGEDQSLEPFRD